MWRSLLYLLLAAALLAGCTSTEEKDKTANWSAERIYAEASGALREGNHEKAIKNYELLEARYPYGQYAAQAQLDIAYAYSKYDEPDAAIDALDRFIRLHPDHPELAYAYYMKGIVNSDRNLGLMDRFVATDASQRDPLAYRQANLDPPGSEDADADAEIPDEALAAAVPTGTEPSVPNGDDGAAAPPVTEGQEADRSGRASRPVRRGPEGTRSASGGNLGDAADRADATIAEFAVPEALTQAQVNAMTIEEVRQEITVRAEARRRARSSGDEALEARLRSEFDMLMTRLRKGS